MMKLQTLISTIILLFFLLSSPSAQIPLRNQLIKRETKITKLYDYDQYVNGQMISGRTANIKTDTIVTEYNPDGTVIKSTQPDNGRIAGQVIMPLKKEFVSEKGNLKHEKEYLSDSSVIDIYTYNYKDSVIELRKHDSTTLTWTESHFRKGKLVRSHQENYHQNFYIFSETIFYKKSSKHYKNILVVKTYSKDGPSDSSIIIHNYRRGVSKRRAFNTDKNEWYVINKTIGKRFKTISYDTFYHDGHKSYFTKKTTSIHNKSGDPVHVITYAKHLKRIISETCFLYDYY